MSQFALAVTKQVFHGILKYYHIRKTITVELLALLVSTLIVAL